MIEPVDKMIKPLNLLFPDEPSYFEWEEIKQPPKPTEKWRYVEWREHRDAYKLHGEIRLEDFNDGRGTFFVAETVHLPGIQKFRDLEKAARWVVRGVRKKLQDSEEVYYKPGFQRVSFDSDRDDWESLKKLAEVQGIDVYIYLRNIIRNHVREAYFRKRDNRHGTT